MKKMFITAAPVGAVPKKIYSSDANFVSSSFLYSIKGSAHLGSLEPKLLASGWVAVKEGGFEISHLKRTKNDSAVIANPFKRLHFEIASSLVGILTRQGWRISTQGNLIWPHKGGVSFIPPELVVSLSSITESLVLDGWEKAEAGVWRECRASSIDLPITPEEIILEAKRCFEQGAAVVHLHTRKTHRLFFLNSNDINIRLEEQKNVIDESQYDLIIPGILNHNDNIILNISTSIRGGLEDYSSPVRRAPLKPYSDKNFIPQVASFSPGRVLFSSGGGYCNPNKFLAMQLLHFRIHEVRPEVEVFNNSILRNAISTYARALQQCGLPVLFMLVACIDQQTSTGNGNYEDDSLVPPHIRIRALKLLAENDKAARAQAILCIANSLKPKVETIRSSFPSSKISILLPGILQTIIVEVADLLDLDGLRVGLEDSLVVADQNLNGVVRAASGTHEQVSFVYQKLRDKKIDVMSVEEVKSVLNFKHRK